MVYWNRFISYIFRYHNFEKCENTGFAKVQKQADRGKMQIHLKDQIKKEGVYSVYLYRETLADSEEYPEVAPDSMIPVLLYLGKLILKSGRGEGEFVFDWNNIKQTGRPVPAWSGIIIRSLGDDKGDIFCSSWTENEVDYSHAFEEKTEPDDVIDSEMSQNLENNAEMISESNTDITSASELKNAENADFRQGQTGQRQLELTQFDQERIEQGRTNRGQIRQEQLAQEQMDQKQIKQEQISQERIQQGRTEQAKIGQEQIEQENAGTEEEENRVTAAEVLATMKEEGRADELMASREKLPLLPNCPNGESGIVECVKINPNDIGLLNMDNWRLGVNSFLTHGFYSYKYLMLGRVLFDEEKTNGYILGVPGEYSAKEKYLAGIFGFDRFIPAKETRIKTGSFGYWVVDLK